MVSNKFVSIIPQHKSFELAIKNHIAFKSLQYFKTMYRHMKKKTHRYILAYHVTIFIGIANTILSQRYFIFVH